MHRSATTLRALLTVLVLLGLGTSPVMAAPPISPGDILVADPGNGTIRHYSASGVDLSVFASGLASPSWITADQGGNIYVSEYGGGRVDKLSSSGANLRTITTPYTPGGVAIGSDGTLYVAHYGAGKIHHYSASGADLGIFASYTGCETGCGTDFIKFDADGNLYVGDFQPQPVGRIRLISPAGIDLGDFVTGIVSGPEGIALASDNNLYVGNYLTFTIEKFSPSGADLGTFAALGGTGSAYGLAFDRTGNLYAANYAAGTIHKFSPSGTDLGIFASSGLVLPRDLVVVPGPVTKDQCKNGGWETFQFPRLFKNQGDCVQFFNTGK